MPNQQLSDSKGNVLGLWTASGNAVVSVKRGEGDIHIKESYATNTHSEALSTLVSECLEEASLSVADLDLVAIAIGPGSFTGLRIGVSFAMGLCIPQNMQVIPLSSLLIIAACVDETSDPVRPILDAKRNELFTALFKKSSNGMERIEEDRLVGLTDLTSTKRARIVCLKEERDALANPANCFEASNAEVGRSLVRESVISTSRPVSANCLRPNYLRRSAAEEKLSRP